MRTPTGPDVPTVAGGAQDILLRFEDSWVNALSGAARPDLEASLAETPAEDRARLRPQLERLDQEYAARLAAGGDPGNVRTIDQPRAELPGDPGDSGCLIPGPTIADRPQGRDTKPELDLTLDSSSGTLNGPTGQKVGGRGGQLVAGYEIQGELGRGAMGVVYKARQIGLNRTVALKMVLAGVHASRQQLDRFCLEAEAAARLQHQNIVQIHEVGERDGLPFFSLEFVEGGSLSELIRKEPQPPERAARLAAMLAHGIQYAHDHGIVHRDLKPSNVLMTPDGVPKITDFGLAKKLDDGAGGHTQTGAVVGTPSYMAPEQARGEARGVGPAADTYSLGAILYEMLTGRPPFLGSTVLETLEQVQSKDPVPPRQLVPKIPRDLETICLKCLQKDPAKRYASTGALADDLDRFLAGKPILARPVGSVARFIRWFKRNPRIAGLTAAVVVLLVAGTVVSTTLAIGMARERSQKEEERERAEQARVLAEEARAQAQKNADEVIKQGGLALRAFGTLIDEAQKEIGDRPGMQPLKLKLLESALVGLDKVASGDEDSRLLGQSTAAAYLKLGQLFQQMGQTEKAFAQIQKSNEIARALAKRDPEGPVAMANLAATLTALGQITLELNRDVQVSLGYYQEALRLRQSVVNSLLDGKLDPIRVRQDLAEAHTRVGVTFLRIGEPDRAAGYFNDALTIREELARAHEKILPLQLDVARSHMALGELRFRSRDWPAGKEEFGRTLAICERVHQAEPKNPQYKLELAHSLGNFGMFALRTADLATAKEHLLRCQGLMDELAGWDKKHVDYQRYLALADYRCGSLARRLGDPEAAGRWNRKCLEIREVLAANSENVRRQIELLLVQSRIGGHKAMAEQAARIESRQKLDREVLVELAQCFSQAAAGLVDDPELRKQYLDRSLDMIRRALEQGYKDHVLLETDPDLDAVRERPQFQALLSANARAPGG